MGWKEYIVVGLGGWHVTTSVFVVISSSEGLFKFHLCIYLLIY